MLYRSPLLEASPGTGVDRAPEEQDQGSPSSLTAPAPRSPPLLPASTGQRIRHPSSPGWGDTTLATALCCEPPAHRQAGHPGKPCFFAKTAWSRTRSESALRGAGAVGGHNDRRSSSPAPASLDDQPGCRAACSSLGASRGCSGIREPRDLGWPQDALRALHPLGHGFPLPAKRAGGGWRLRNPS